MKVEPLSFYEVARTSHIKRWHIVNTSSQQNLAEHSYNVTMIGLELYTRVLGVPPTAEFILSLLFHDSAEIRYGDIPTPGKSFMRDFVEDKSLFSSMDDSIMPCIPYSNSIHDPSGEEFVKLADLIEAAWWIRENGVGAHAKVVADKCWQAVVEFVHRRGWYDACNAVLSDLGMPTINKGQRVTPP